MPNNVYNFDVVNYEYTVNLKLLLEKGITFFDFNFNFVDEDVKSDFILMFKRRFMFNEIGYETVERFMYEIETHTIMNVEHYAKLYEAYNQNIDILKNIASEQTSNIKFADMPQHVIDELTSNDIISSQTTNNQKASGYQSITPIELIEKYAQKLKDVLSDFIETYKIHFMQIY